MRIELADDPELWVTLLLDRDPVEVVADDRAAEVEISIGERRSRAPLLARLPRRDGIPSAAAVAMIRSYLDPERGAIQLIPGLERHGDQVRSVGLTWGGFMPLHGGDGGWNTPPSTISAFQSVNGRHIRLASLNGQGISQLSPTAAPSPAGLPPSRAGHTAKARLDGPGQQSAPITAPSPAAQHPRETATVA